MADSNSTRSIGFVGLGAMGLSVVQNLARAGYRVQGFDLATGALATLEEAGGAAMASSAEAASGAEALIVMVVDADQARAVDDIAARVEAAGRPFVDAPVSGGAAGARAASLTIMAAAPAAHRGRAGDPR